MESSTPKQTDHRSGTKIALAIFGFIVGLTALLLALKALLQ